LSDLLEAVDGGGVAALILLDLSAAWCDSNVMSHFYHVQYNFKVVSFVKYNKFAFDLPK